MKSAFVQITTIFSSICHTYPTTLEVHYFQCLSYLSETDKQEQEKKSNFIAVACSILPSNPLTIL